ncbi:MAG TPA: DUF721 domain-containing protein [Balneolales bacterium]|nr:DUF721 domain-containing protein [Balneolales bacterium]
MSYYSRDPKPLSSVLKEYIKEFPYRKRLKKGMILSQWPAIVGDAIAKQSKNLHFEGDKLIVTVRNPAWRQELHMQRYAIAKKLNDSVKEEIIKEIIVRS